MGGFVGFFGDYAQLDAMNRMARERNRERRQQAKRPKVETKEEVKDNVKEDVKDDVKDTRIIPVHIISAVLRTLPPPLVEEVETETETELEDNSDDQRENTVSFTAFDQTGRLVQV
jgi:hypothetical protein